MSRKSRVSAFLLFVCLAVSLTNCAAVTGLTRPDRANAAAAPVQDAHIEVARQYAPFVYHSTDGAGFRQDLFSNIDFDGDLRGDNNWENFAKYQLRPTVYYAVLESETHWFIAYHFFHPRDWNHFTFWMNDTHENDGENCQVVVRKSDGRVILVWTQAHYRSRIYSPSGSGIGFGVITPRTPCLLVDDRGIVNEKGTHAAVFVEDEGHGVYGLSDAPEVSIRNDGIVTFRDGGLLYRPAAPGETVAEPTLGAEQVWPYQLESITAKLWPLLRDGLLTGDGKLFDGVWTYKHDKYGELPVPRYYDSDKFSGPFGNDRGISPFALDLNWERGALGALFYDPAKRYAEILTISEAWSREYATYPFVMKR